MKPFISIPKGTPANARDLIAQIKQISLSFENTTVHGNVFVSSLAIYMPYSYDASNPSVRLRRLSLKACLKLSGIKVDIIHRFEDLAPYENVLISHYGLGVADQLKQLKLAGKKLFYDHSENLWGFPHQKEAFDQCDVIVCCSTKLAEITSARIGPKQRAAVMPDFIEGWGKLPTHIPTNREKLKVVWCGMGGNAFMAKELEPIIKELGFELVIISEWGDADVKWELDTYFQHMADCDIAICPQRVDVQPAKSNVKVTTALALGLPVVCSPLPSYLEVVNDGVNGFVASNHDEWRSALSQLADYSRRKQISKQALDSIANYTPQKAAARWLSLLLADCYHVALINNSLQEKYSSYGDYWLDYFRCAGAVVDQFTYDEISQLPSGYDLYFFIEVRYPVEEIANVKPRVLYTTEPQNLNVLPHFDLVATTINAWVDAWRARGFVNTVAIPNIAAPPVTWFDPMKVENFSRLEDLRRNTLRSWMAERTTHNELIHSRNINSFHKLMQPEERWNGGMRDRKHIEYTMDKLGSNSRVLDIGSADGWLSLYLAAWGHKVSALEFVDRGMKWTLEHAERLNIEIDLRKGFIEDVFNVFHEKRFDAILAYEILEHLDYRQIPWYLDEMQKLLVAGGQILISLPMQDLNDNPEHLWSPSQKLIEKIFEDRDATITWVEIPQHEVPGDWFIQCRRAPVVHRVGL